MNTFLPPPPSLPPTATATTTATTHHPPKAATAITTKQAAVHATNPLHINTNPKHSSTRYPSPKSLPHYLYDPSLSTSSHQARLFCDCVFSTHLDPRVRNDLSAFVRLMKLDSAEFMAFWKFAAAQNNEWLQSLLFYKEFCLLEDSLASQTVVSSREIASQFTIARLAGFTGPMRRFVESRIGITARSVFPPPPPPSSYGDAHFVCLADDVVIANPRIVSSTLRAHVQRVLDVEGEARGDGVEVAIVMGKCADAVVEYLFAHAFRDYASSSMQPMEPVVADVAGVAAENPVPTAKAVFGVSGSPVLESPHTHLELPNSIEVLAHEHSSLAPEYRKRFVEGMVGIVPTKSESQHSPEGAVDSKRIIGGLATSPAASGVMLYTPGSATTKGYKQLLDISGFMERKDAEQVHLEHSRYCFVKCMDMDSVLYREFSYFLRRRKRINLIEFYEKTCELDDEIASHTVAPSPETAVLYNQARASGLNASLARFIRHTAPTDPSLRRLLQLPTVPEIPVAPIPTDLGRQMVVELYGSFLGKGSAYEIVHVFGSARRPAVQNALQQSFLRAVEGNILYGCVDDLMEVLFKDLFQEFVLENSDPRSGKGKHSAKDLVKQPSSNRSEKEGSAGSFLTSWLKGRKKGSMDKQVVAGGSNEAVVVSSESSRRVMSPIERSMMLYEVSSVFKYGGHGSMSEPPIILSLGHACFVKLMKSHGKELKEFQSFARADQSFENFQFYHAVCKLEDELASTIPTHSQDDAISYRAGRATGMTQGLTRFVKQLMESEEKEEIPDLSEMALLPPIPTLNVPSNMKNHFLEIYHTFISPSAPKDVTLSDSICKHVQCSVEQDYLIPMNTALFNACIDDVLNHIFIGTFYRFVMYKQGGHRVPSAVMVDSPMRSLSGYDTTRDSQSGSSRGRMLSDVAVASGLGAVYSGPVHSGALDSPLTSSPARSSGDESVRRFDSSVDAAVLGQALTPFAITTTKKSAGVPPMSFTRLGSPTSSIQVSSPLGQNGGLVGSRMHPPTVSSPVRTKSSLSHAQATRSIKEMRI